MTTPEDGFPSPSQIGFTYQIHVLGNIHYPGTYDVPPSTRILSAINLAGGPIEEGSERLVEVRKQGEPIKRYDLLAYKIMGRLEENPYIQDNDVIYVPLKKKIVRIGGTVKRPGFYEILNEKSVEDIINLAGGTTAGTANPAPIKVIRYSHGLKEVLDVENKPESRKNFELKNADVIYVPHFLTEKTQFDYKLATLPGEKPQFLPSSEERVFVLGGVNIPGPYPFNPYYSVNHYLTAAGGTTKLAKTGKIMIANMDGKIVKAMKDSEINPGDTIRVPERYMPPETWLTLGLTLSSTLLGITTAMVSLSR